MAGWYVVSKGRDEQYRFVLKAGNAEIILTSEGYTVRSSAETGIASVQKNCGNDELYVREVARDGRFYFNLKALNHEIIGTSQMYATAASREGGIASVKANGATSIIKDA